MKSVLLWWKQACGNKLPQSNVIAAQYQAWQQRFLWQRLRLWLWLAFICVLSFTLRDFYDIFFDLKEFENLPKVLRYQGLAINTGTVLSLLACLVLHKTKFGRRRPGVLFLGLSWSISLVEQIVSTVNGFALPDIANWSLLFLSQATFMPVRWTLHLVSQLGLLIYYFGVNTALELKLPPPHDDKPIYTVTLILYLFWLCAICTLGVYLYECLKRSEFFARKELETAYEKLEVAEAKYRSIFENAVEGIFQSTPDGRYITANPALARIYGYSSPSEVTANFTDIEHQLYVDPNRRAEFMRLIEEYGSVSEFESQIYRFDNSIVWISEKAYAVRDEKGKLLYYEGLIEDITKRKQAETALQEQFNFLQVLIDTIPTPVFYKNAQGFYMGCNKAFEESLGLKKEEVVGKCVFDIGQNTGEQYHEADKALFEQHLIQTYESSIVYKDGKKHDVIVYKATFSKADNSVGGLVGVILDISDRKRTEEALRGFFHGVSHDLRNPVLGTLMVLRNLLRQPEEKITVARSILERMEQSSDRQLNLINSLMEAHASEVQGIALQRQPVQLSTVVEAAISDLQPMLTENQAILTNLVSADIPSVNADPTQLWRVFSNLIVNAIKHNPPGLSITVNATVEGDKICCTVRDNGVGMSQQQCEHLFDLYYRGVNARSSIGLGLGLYMCKQIITAHGGEIGVKSAPQAGATFWFTLPII